MDCPLEENLIFIKLDGVVGISIVGVIVFVVVVRGQFGFKIRKIEI